MTLAGVQDGSEVKGGESWARLADVESEDLISSHTSVGIRSLAQESSLSLSGVKHAYINQTILWLDCEGEMLI